MARVFEGQFIGGRSATRRMFKDLNPADGSVWAEVPDCGPRGRLPPRSRPRMRHSRNGRRCLSPSARTI